jgi:hypothetical protein
MTPYERTLRLTVAAVGLSMAVTTAALVAILLADEPFGFRMWMGGAIALPLFYAAATVYLLPPPSVWQKLLVRLLVLVFLASGVILASGAGAVAGQVTREGFLAVAFTLPLCLHLPVGGVCFVYLTVLTAKRLFGEPDGDEPRA